MGVTLKQIADELGVSQPLVTYALNGRPGVSEAMRLKIQETAARMGYSRASNLEAQYLIARRHGKRPLSGIIALIYPLPQRKSLNCFLSQPFYRDIIHGIESEVRSRNLDLLITPTCGERIPRIIQERRVDGVMFPSDMTELDPLFRDLGLPAVSLCTWNETTYNLVPDDEAGGYAATSHLLKLGHRRIAFIGAISFQGNARYDGYKRALTEYGITLDDKMVVRPDLNFCQEEDGRANMKALISRCAARLGSRPTFTAIVCQNDSLAIGVVRFAQEYGLRVPEDLSVVGFDDISSLFNFHPLVTSLSYSRYDIGREGVKWLCGEIAAMTAISDKAEYRYQPRYGVKTFPMALTMHQTTAPPPKMAG